MDISTQIKETPTLRIVAERVEELHAKIDALTAAREMDNSPWLRGDSAAAAFVGYKTRVSFRQWAKAHGIKPRMDDGINFWDKAEIIKARSA